MKVLCREGKQDVEREVTRMSLDPANVLRVYDSLKGVPNLFSSKGESKVKDLADLYDSRNVVWQVDNVGIVYLAGLAEGKAHVHITFWDKRLRGREELARQLAREAMAEFGFHTLVTAIPPASRATLAFAKRVGFKVYSLADEYVLLYLTPEAL